MAGMEGLRLPCIERRIGRSWSSVVAARKVVLHQGLRRSREECICRRDFGRRRLVAVRELCAERSSMSVLPGEQIAEDFFSITPTGTSDVLEEVGDDFVEVGLICSTHGVKGEVKVMARTDFPEQRFQQLGIRWIGFYQIGKLVNVRQVELVGGRKIILGKEPSWLLSFHGVDTVEVASQLVGGVVLVKADDRPTLEEGQLYIPDLVGMSVVLKSSGDEIGSIVDVFNSGASDLLRVRLSSFCKEDLSDEKTKEQIERLVWVPFVEEIVPVVDMKGRRIEIVPPDGLLELNAPSKQPLKRILQKEALRTRRKLQEQTAGIKKRVLALKQGHILSGLALGDKALKEALRAQLIGIDFKLFECALETFFEQDSQVYANDVRQVCSSSEVVAVDWKGLDEWIASPTRDLSWENKINKETWTWWRAGLEVVAEGRVAIVTLPTEDDNQFDAASLKSSIQHQAQELLDLQSVAKVLYGEKPPIGWVVITSEASEECTKSLFRDEQYFGLNEEQVFFVKLSCLPFVSREEKDGLRKIIMESEWRIVTGPGGECQVLLDLDDSGVLNDLLEMGVDYIHVQGASKPGVRKTDPVIFGYMEEQGSSMAMKVTRTPLEGEHGVLCHRRSASGISTANDDHDHDHVYQQDSTNEKSGNVAFMAGSYGIVSSNLLDKTSLEGLETGYRVSPYSSYTFTAEYLKYLSQQRRKLRYAAVPKKVCKHLQEEDGRWVEALSDESNAFQLKCCIQNSLLFCPPSKVALLETEEAAVAGVMRES